MDQVKEGATIENPRAYEPDAVEHLRRLLQAGGRTQPDPLREHFYEIEGHGETYYVHISPMSGNVVLLAKWLRHPHGCCVSSEPLVA